MKLGLGTVQLGLNYGIANSTGKPDRNLAAAILQTAANGGIGCFDTAGSYGDSEEIIGQFIKESGVRPKIGTKFSACASAERELQESLQRLGVDKLDYFLLHKPEQVFLPEFSQVIELLKHNPAVGKVGVSVYNVSEAEECLKQNVQVIQIPFNIIDSRFIKGELLERAKYHGIELHARSIYLQGLLLCPAQGTCPPALTRLLHCLESLAKELGISVKELCFLYVRDSVYIDRFFIGCETVEQVMDNLALHRLPELPGAFMSRVQQIFADVPDKILNPSLWQPN